MGDRQPSHIANASASAKATCTTGSRSRFWIDGQPRTRGEFRHSILPGSSRHLPASSAGWPAQTSTHQRPSAAARGRSGRDLRPRAPPSAARPVSLSGGRAMFRRTRAVRVALILPLLIASAAPGRAQADRGTITGTVTDSSGGVVASASVKAVHVATNFERTVTTSDQGTYTIPQLRSAATSSSSRRQGFRRRRSRTSRSRPAAPCAWTRRWPSAGCRTPSPCRPRAGRFRPTASRSRPPSAASSSRTCRSSSAGSCDRRSTSA